MTKPKCTVKKPLCLACRAAAGIKRSVIFTTDMDAEALRLREGGASLARRLEKRP